MIDGVRTSTVLEIQRSGERIKVGASRRRGSAGSTESEAGAELRGILRLVPLLLRAMTFDASAAR